MIDVNADDTTIPQVQLDDISIENRHNKAVIGVVVVLFVLTLVTALSTLGYKTYLSSASEIESSNVIAPTLTSIPSPTSGSRPTIHPCPSYASSLSPYVTKKPTPSGPLIPTMTPIPSGSQIPTMTPIPSGNVIPTIVIVTGRPILTLIPSGEVTPTNPPRRRPIELPVSPTPCPH